MNSSDCESFPRGGRQILPKFLTGQKRKHEHNLFALETKQKKKKVRQDKVSKNGLSKPDEILHLSANSGTLSYNKIQDGMLLLSCVRHISNLAVQVEFPGLVYGNITINQISETFNNKLSKYLKTESEGFYGSELKNIVRIGQLIPAKILSIKKSDKGHEVHATANPKYVNSDKKHDSFRKGEIIWANVVSELDHGYELTAGINNCRVFLPFKNTNELKKYGVGEPLYCSIHKVDSSDFVTTLTVSAKKQHINSCQANDSSLSAVLPGMKVNFIIEEISSQGVKGQFLDNCFGYINELEVLMTSGNKKLKEGSTVTAYVLYVEPITKVTYLTLRDLENLPKPQFESGKIISAKVILSGGKGLYVQVGKNGIGFVANKRLLNTISKDAQVDIIQAIRNKYPVGSHHDCRILDYNLMQQLYVCTFEKQIIMEKVFSLKDVTIGEAVKVTVDNITSNGLVVKTGHIQGFVPNIHLSNVKYTENIKAKFSIGMKIDARVLKFTNEGRLLLTLKQSLVESKQCLTKIEDALPNIQQVGYVVQTKLAGALIKFYENAKGWLSKKTLNVGNSGRYIDPRDFFFIGQVVRVWILGIKNNRLQLSLNKPNNEKRKKNQGDPSDKDGIAIHPEHINLQVDEENNDKLNKPNNKKRKKKQANKSDKETIAINSEHINLQVDDIVPKAQLSDDILSRPSLKDGNSCTINEVPVENKVSKSQPVLSGAHCFYTTEDGDTKQSDSSEEDEDKPEQNRKRKKLSAAERADMAKTEEERISKIERHLADNTKTPQSAEEFDRLLLANPNSSELWLQYIAMHVTATELDKARAVGKKAIETINMTLVNEKFNIWIALLNLENMYGTKDSFEIVFGEAIRYNDLLDTYLSVIKILGASGKLIEMEEKIKKLRSREKQNSRMWLEIGRVYYSLKKFQEARNIKEAALKSILDKRKQFDIVMRFGVMEFQLGELEHAVATFETILDNYPSKVNIWIIYVDQLVKQKHIEHARKVLERAINQKFAVKTMKVLFQKFVSFEEQQGTVETVEKIKCLAKEYITSLGTR